jgi:hypothetical protein
MSSQNSTPYVQLSTDAPTRARFIFWFTSDAFLKKHVSSFQDSYVKFLRGDLQAKVVPERTTGLRIVLLEESCEEYLQASLQADSALTRCHEKRASGTLMNKKTARKGH